MLAETVDVLDPAMRYAVEHKARPLAPEVLKRLESVCSLLQRKEQLQAKQPAKLKAARPQPPAQKLVPAPARRCRHCLPRLKQLVALVK